MEKDIESLFHAHQKISEEIGQAEILMENDTHFKKGHVNGLKKANNRIEELIYKYFEEEFSE